MRRTVSVMLGLVAAMALLAFALAMPVAAERGYPPGWRGSASTSQASTDEARTAAEDWLAENGYSDLVVADLVDVDGRFYAVIENAAGGGAFELLVSRNGSWVHPAPTMMWNTSFDLMTVMMDDMPHGDMSSGMMGDMGGGMLNGDHPHGQHGFMNGGMMADGGMAGTMNPAACQTVMGPPATDPLAEPLTVAEAAVAAQVWLNANQVGSTATDSASFPGYVTLRISDGGTVTGLIAVQLTTGTVWPLPWPAS